MEFLFVGREFCFQFRFEVGLAVDCDVFFIFLHRPCHILGPVEEGVHAVRIQQVPLACVRQDSCILERYLLLGMDVGFSPLFCLLECAINLRGLRFQCRKLDSWARADVSSATVAFSRLQVASFGRRPARGCLSFGNIGRMVSVRFFCDFYLDRAVLLSFYVFGHDRLHPFVYLPTGLQP